MKLDRAGFSILYSALVLSTEIVCVVIALTLSARALNELARKGRLVAGV